MYSSLRSNGLLAGRRLRSPPVPKNQSAANSCPPCRDVLVKRLMLRGRVTTGAGGGASFTRVAWVREQFITKLGIDPYPGTLNLLLDSPTEIMKWNDLKDTAWCARESAGAELVHSSLLSDPYQRLAPRSHCSS